MPIQNNVERREYQREWMRKRRNAFFDGRKCAYCGSEDNLELDHVDPSTKVDHKVWSWSESRRNEELEKCQPLCDQCHSKKTILEKTNHGISRYNRGGCRCYICKKAKSYFNSRRVRMA